MESKGPLFLFVRSLTMGTHRWTRVQPLESRFGSPNFFKFPSWPQGDNNDLMDLHYCWWKQSSVRTMQLKNIVSIPHYSSGFWKIHPNGGWVGLGIFWTNNRIPWFPQFWKIEGKTFSEVQPRDFSGFFCVGSLHSVGSHPFGVGAILSLSKEMDCQMLSNNNYNPNHTEDNHTITPKDFERSFICSVRCTRPRMSSKRRGARPMRRCRGTW